MRQGRDGLGLPTLPRFSEPAINWPDVVDTGANPRRSSYGANDDQDHPWSNRPVHSHDSREISTGERNHCAARVRPRKGVVKSMRASLKAVALLAGLGIVESTCAIP